MINLPPFKNYARALCAAALITMIQTCLAAAETSNGPALRIGTKMLSIKEVETVFFDSYALLQDKLRKGELAQSDLPQAIKTAWTSALESATQDNIIDQNADEKRRATIRMYLSHLNPSISEEKALELFRRDEADYIRRLRRMLVAAAGGEEELRKALKRRGQRMEEWEATLSRELFRRISLEAELGPVLTSPSASKAYYEKHPDQFSTPEAWRLRRILVAKVKFSSADVALTAARKVKEKIDSGADFAEIAQKISVDPAYAQAGGLLTRDGKADLPSGNFPAEEKIAETLKDGQISEPVDAGECYILVQRAGYRPASVLKFEDSAERAEALAYSEKLKQKKAELYEKLKKKYLVEVIQKDPPERLLALAKTADLEEFVQPKK
jgi:parvulin-like peptidyl-prolyl isomerase